MSSGDGEPESREAVATVVNYASDLRPSLLASASLPALAVACPAQAQVLGQSAASIHVRTAPAFSLYAGTSAINKINNYNGITSAMGEGVAASIVEGPTVSATWLQMVQVDKAKGGDARGIPPRGRPV